MDGRKDDTGKARYDLIPFDSLDQVAKVLTHGALKYDDDNWIKVPNARKRYTAAALRHFTSWIRGEQDDPETKLNHLAHAICCLMFLLWFDLNGGNNDEKD